MASKISINLDTSKENYLVAKCKQNDDLVLEANIYEDGLALDLTNKEIIIQALKSDRTYIIQNTSITKVNNKIVAELEKDFTRVPGKTLIEIVLVESGKQNTTFSFYVEVVGSVIKGAVESSNTVTILEALENKIVEAGAVKEETEQLITSGGAATKGDIQAVNTQLEQIAYPIIDEINRIPQDSAPQKIGLQENSFKLVVKNNNNHYSVIQKTNKDYLLYDLKNGASVGGKGSSDFGSNWDLLRVTRVKPVPACYVYTDDYVITGTKTDYLLEGNYTAIEQALFQFYAPIVINEYKSNKASNGGLKCVGVKSADGTGKFTFSFKMTKVNKGNILIMCSSASSTNNEIQVNGKVVKIFDATCTSGNEYRLIEFDLPIKYSNDVITVDIINKDTSSKNLYLICANFKELKDYKGEWITQYKAFIDTCSYIDNNGANEYAMLDNASQKYCGSYHGGETLINGKLSWINSDRFDIDQRKIETTISNSVVDGSFCIIKDFYVRQRTQIGTLGQMYSEFNFSIDGTIGMKMSWNGDITTDYFYTNLVCTHPNFNKVYYPQYLELKDTENQDYYLKATQGLVVQADETNQLRLETRFDKFNSSWIGKDLWIKSLSTSYRKPYYGFLGKTNVIKNVTFNKFIDFYRV